MEKLTIQEMSEIASNITPIKEDIFTNPGAF